MKVLELVAVALVVVVANACLLLDDDGASPEAACSRVCDCALLPAERAQCSAECIEAAPQIPRDCLDCLAVVQACSELSRGACALECSVIVEPLGLDFDQETSQ